MLKKVSAQSHEIEMGYIHYRVYKANVNPQNNELFRKTSTYATLQSVDLHNVAKCRLTQRRLLNAQYVDLQN